MGLSGSGQATRVTFGVSSRCLPQFQNPKLRPEIVERRHRNRKDIAQIKFKYLSFRWQWQGFQSNQWDISLPQSVLSSDCYTAFFISIALRPPSEYRCSRVVLFQNFFYCRNLCHTLPN